MILKNMEVEPTKFLLSIIINYKEFNCKKARGAEHLLMH